MNFVLEKDAKNKFDLIIVNMEVWSVIRALAKSIIYSKVCVVFHGMPFLGYLHNPTWNFNLDVKNKIKVETEKFKSEFNKKYHPECEKILSKINCIASNKTCSYFLKKYFKDLKIWTMDKYPRLSLYKQFSRKDFNFAYMARIESGKGMEFLPKIFEHISKNTDRKIKVAILGKIDDEASKLYLDKLKNNSIKNIGIKYFGHADTKLKKKILSKTKVFIYPSVYDNNPTVVYEAVSFGLPIVMWNTLFSKINFGKLDFVKLIQFKKANKFAKICLDLTENSKVYNKAIMKFLTNRLYSAKEIASIDAKIFNQIYNSINENCK